MCFTLRQRSDVNLCCSIADDQRPSSRLNHALANVHSRITVPEETPSASAVSSMLKPPKKRSSIILLLRSSNRASALSASSSATTSAAAFGETARASVIHQYPSHHLRRDGEELGATLPVRVFLINQSHIGFVDE